MINAARYSISAAIIDGVSAITDLEAVDVVAKPTRDIVITNTGIKDIIAIRCFDRIPERRPVNDVVAVRELPFDEQACQLQGRAGRSITEDDVLEPCQITPEETAKRAANACGACRACR